MVSTTFLRDFFGRLLRGCHEHQSVPTDVSSFELFFDLNLTCLSCKWRRIVRSGRQPQAQALYDVAVASETVVNIMARGREFEQVYGQLSDDTSRNTLIDVLVQHCLGSRHVTPLMPTNSFWSDYKSIDPRFLKAPQTRRYWQWNLNLYEYPGVCGPILLHATPLHILCEFQLQQYRLGGAAQRVEATLSETVIDGGACFGDTALYFADRVGAKGMVYSFEFLPANVALFQENMSLNPQLRQHVELVENALGATSGQSACYHDNGPATLVSVGGNQSSPCQVTTLSVDDFAAQIGRPIDFIKLDIEGAELACLHGAEHTLRTSRPKLAIAIYHSLQDLFAIQLYLDSLNVGYRFYIRHFTPTIYETVLFAVA